MSGTPVLCMDSGCCYGEGTEVEITALCDLVCVGAGRLGWVEPLCLRSFLGDAGQVGQSQIQISQCKKKQKTDLMVMFRCMVRTRIMVEFSFQLKQLKQLIYSVGFAMPSC